MQEMKGNCVTLLACFVLLVVLAGMAVAQVDEAIFKAVDATNACPRILFSSGVTGCADSGFRRQGFLELVQDFGNITQTKEFRTFLVRAELLNAANMRKLASVPRIAGVIVFQQKDEHEALAKPYSPQKVSPNDEITASKYAWNPKGDGLLFESLPFSIAYVEDEEEIDNLLLMAQKNRESKDFRPFHAQVTLSQQASLNSIHCLKQDSCRPIGGYSIWTHFGTQEISRPLVLVSAAMDTRSMFPRKSSPGSISDGSALVSLLAAAHALGNISSDDYEMLPNQIMFAVFQGEAFSYTGSRRFLHDLKEFKCQNEDNGRCALPIRTTMDFKKISLRSFSSHISLTHIYGDNLFLHPAKNGNSAELVELVRNVSKELSSQDLYKDATPTLPELPPSTAVPFSITLPNLPSLVIAGYDEQISNPYYHSFQDISSELSVSLICDAATLTAQSALAAAADNELKNVQDLVSTVRADCDLVSKLIYCFTKNLNCVLSQELGIPLAKLETSSGSTVASRYSGQYYPVREIDSITGTQRLVFELLTKFSELKQQGPQCSSNEDCSKSSGLGYGRCENGFCTTSMARYHEAYDPGIELDYDSLVFEVVNSSCPNWAESLTSLGEIRLFRVEKNSIVVGMLSAGFAVFLSSALILKYSSHYFSSHFKI